jgi:hypothetical protein
MGARGVIAQTPTLDDGAGFRQGQEPVLAQALVPESPVEALDEGILHRPPGPNEVQLHAVCLGPGVQRPTLELRPVVHPEAR